MKKYSLIDLTSNIIDGVFGKIIKNEIIEYNSNEKILPLINVIDNKVVISGYIKRIQKVERNIIKKGDIILSKLANVGEPYIFDLPNVKIGVLSTNFINISPNYNKVDSETLFYYFKNLKLKGYWNRHSNINITTNHISLKNVKDIKLLIPDNSKEIIKIIQLLDTDVNLYKELLLKEIKRQEFFLDNLLNGTLLNEDKIITSQIGGVNVNYSNNYNIIPNDVITLQQWIAFNKSDYSITGKRVVRIRDIVNENTEIVYSSKKINKKYEVSNKDFLICLTGTKDSKSLGKLGKNVNGYFNNELFKFFSNNEGLVLTKYLYYYFQTKFFKKTMLKFSEGSVLLNCKRVKGNIKIIAPNIIKQKEIIKILEQQDEVINNTKEIIYKKRQIRNNLIKKINLKK